MKSKIITVLFLVLILACGLFHPIKRGQITDKQRIPAHTWVMFYPMICGKTTMIIPIPMYSPDAYEVTFAGVDADSGRTRTIYIDEAWYDSIRVGECIDISGRPCSDEIPAEKQQESR